MCYESLVGLKGCGDQQPSTGLFIDTLGINESFLAQLITDQYDTGYDLFIDKLNLSYKRISNEILNRLSPALKSDTIIENRRIGQLLTNYKNVQSSLSSGVYGGIRVKINPNETSFLNFYLSDLTLNIDDSNTNLTIYVFDLNKMKLIESFIYTQGSISQFIGKQYKSAKRKLDLAIVYEQTFDVAKTITKNGSCSTCGGGFRFAHICPFVDAIGVNLLYDGNEVTSVNNVMYTSGMSINYNINCDRESFICSIGGNISIALAYLTASEIYDYALTISPNQRVNTSVIINRGQKPFATAAAVEGIVAARDIAVEKYNNELSNLISNMRLPEDNHCFDCRKNIKYVVSIP
jgi:hypothetical protein